MNQLAKEFSEVVTAAMRPLDPKERWWDRAADILKQSYDAAYVICDAFDEEDQERELERFKHEAKQILATGLEDAHYEIPPVVRAFAPLAIEGIVNYGVDESRDTGMSIAEWARTVAGPCSLSIGEALVHGGHLLTKAKELDG